MVFRIYVEKKRGLDNSAKNLLGFIKNYISLEPQSELRTFERYDFDGISKEEFDIISKLILVNNNTETAFVDYLPLTSDWRSFSIAPISGKFQERIFNLKNVARSYGITGNYKVKYSRVIAVSELLNDYKLDEIKSLLVDREYYEFPDNNKALSISDEVYDFGDTVVDEDFLEKNDVQIYQYLNKTSLKMSKETLCIIRDYFKLLKRNPTLVELYSIDSVLNSKNTPENLKFNEINFEDVTGNSPLKITIDEFISMREQAGIEKHGAISLKDIAMAGYDYMKQKGQIQDVVIENGKPYIQAPVDVNGVVEQYLIAFNATKSDKSNGFDILLNRVDDNFEAYQSLCLDCHPFIDRKSKGSTYNTYKTVTTGDYLTDRIAKMNRELGIASSLGGQLFNKHIKKPINYTATAFAGTKQSYSIKLAEGDCIVMLGSKMRIEDLYDKKFKQKTNFLQREKINQFYKQVANETYIKKVLSFSDGIISGLLKEFYGVEIDINRMIKSHCLPLSHLALSVENCRSAVVVSKDSIEKVKAICSNIGLSSHIIGTINKEPYLVVKNGKKQLANISTEFINSLFDSERHSVLINDLSNKKIDFNESYSELQKLSIKDAFLHNLKNISICSKKGVSSSFDSTVGGLCVLAPFGGKNELTPADAFVCKIPTSTGNTNTVTAISYGCNPKISNISPYHGAAFSAMECISKIVATGANSINTKLGVCQNVSNPKGFASKFSNLFSSIFGAFSAEIGMNIPSISYDLSFDKNSEDILDFSCFAISVLKGNEVITPELKSTESTIILVPMPVVQKTGLPDYDKAKVIYRQIHYLSQNGKVLSASVVNEGGIAATVAKMSFGNNIGVEFEDLDNHTLFSAKTASIVIETTNPGAFSGMDTLIIGKTTSEQKFIFNNESVSIGDAVSAFTSTMQTYYPTKTVKKTAMAKIDEYNADEAYSSVETYAKPKVIIPVFTSFSGANDCKRAFSNAGGDVEIYCINPKFHQKSIETLAEKIDGAQILCLPSGSDSVYSAELGYSVMINDVIRNSVENLLKRDGLIIGFGEGFDILLRTGLLIDGKYKTYEKGAFLSDSVTSRPFSGFVRTKIISNKSPWLTECKTGDIYVQATYQSKNRFLADEKTMLKLIENNQVISQYVDNAGKIAAKLPFNPDASTCAVESIISPDGRILGKSSMPQRRTSGCFANVPDNRNIRIFEAGINYFKG